jgi:hypothetical protein
MNYSTETKNILREYATEDANMIKVNGCGAVTDTKKGCLHMSFENRLYTVRATKDDSIFQTPNIECLIEFIMNQYIVEIEA